LHRAIALRAMTGPILCAVDFSDDSEAALLWACNQAGLTGSTLVLLHVVHDPAASPGFYRRPGGDWPRPLTEVAEEMQREFLGKVRRDNPRQTALQFLETRIVAGLPPSRIVEVAAEIGASLIVVGSRGRTGLPHVMLGSVAERVVQIATVPVTVVKHVDSAAT
jgi:nucleotide-binding universal stress UspA family protein